MNVILVYQNAMSLSVWSKRYTASVQRPGLLWHSQLDAHLCTAGVMVLVPVAELPLSCYCSVQCYQKSSESLQTCYPRRNETFKHNASHPQLIMPPLICKTCQTHRGWFGFSMFHTWTTPHSPWLQVSHWVCIRPRINCRSSTWNTRISGSTQDSPILRGRPFEGLVCDCWHHNTQRAGGV